jgi:hypothetical protein
MALTTKTASGNANPKNRGPAGIPDASFIIIQSPQFTRKLQRATQGTGRKSASELLFRHLHIRFGSRLEKQGTKFALNAQNLSVSHYNGCQVVHFAGLKD